MKYLPTIRALLIVGMALAAMFKPTPAWADSVCGCGIDITADCAICVCTDGNGCWWYDDGCDDIHETMCLI